MNRRAATLVNSHAMQRGNNSSISTMVWDDLLIDFDFPHRPKSKSFKPHDKKNVSVSTTTTSTPVTKMNRRAATLTNSHPIQHGNNSSISTKKLSPWDDLLIDFDFPRRHHGESFQFKPLHAKKKVVQFSSSCNVRFYERNDQDYGSELFFSDVEEEAMTEAMYQAVEEVHTRRHELLLSSSTSSSSLEEDVDDDEFGSCSLTGIENLLSQDIVEKIERCRDECVCAVLKEQASQASSGLIDPERLARVSRHHSKWSVKRSRKIGMMQQSR